MKLHHGATSALALATALMASQAGAIGLDRSNQDITAIFEEGNVVELSFGKVFPKISGRDRGSPIETYENVGEDFTNASASVKMDFSNGFSGALIIDQPFGADIAYGGNPETTGFGGTTAQLHSSAVTALGRYRFNDNFSVHAGVRRQTLEADIMLSGQAYGPLNGYSVALEESSANGYLIGAAYEVPEIALRAALTYNSAIEHDFETVETTTPPLQAPPELGGGGFPAQLASTTSVETPESWNLDLQSGVAPDTLVFANIRYAAYEDTRVSPQAFKAATGGASLTNIDDNYQMQVGVGRRLSEMFAVQAAVGFEAEGDERISPLDPTNGKRWVSIGGAYNLDAVTISGGIRYTMLGDASPQVRNPTSGQLVPVADFNDNSAVAIGMSVAYRF
ncbi:long-subunit fatty acid transport protein [Limimaricola variabilis]|uniref:Long-subunit fatty acid transport protein n=1 Tax=Limimaricola variabilis TaxID=1492771 RepID=A0ABR6HJG9_9RHOB|nr:outer membrane protein transport protein [Limimaricola variabilis]MBB3710702.1 long-subunit fatty acid transport protein [Limimaricola variabilis]